MSLHWWFCSGSFYVSTESFPGHTDFHLFFQTHTLRWSVLHQFWCYTSDFTLLWEGPTLVGRRKLFNIWSQYDIESPEMSTNWALPEETAAAWRSPHPGEQLASAGPAWKLAGICASNVTNYIRAPFALDLSFLINWNSHFLCVMVQDFFLLLSLGTYKVSSVCGFPYAWQLFDVTAVLFVGTLICPLPGFCFPWKWKLCRLWGLRDLYCSSRFLQIGTQIQKGVEKRKRSSNDMSASVFLILGIKWWDEEV